ncbi:dimethylargininase [Rhizomicrobium palustre]|uniref:Dimethylargininase n=1 Tax=Rhizomicrobium palustre TaxID=189966 RepID=A0A846MZJ2_9PROT|nr:arginine deiminase family protein [Rhizomicrobium palustre]NIK88521.1 dimethylargininase [Rhizomicrobium palustre]
MRVFDFTHAIVREPGPSVVKGLRSVAVPDPAYEDVLAEHRAYVAALAEAGLVVDIQPPLEDFPDSVFMEDPALVFSEGAILLSPGAPSRLGERDHMRNALAAHFETLHELARDEYADGGDVLVTPKAVFIGLSARTTRPGAEALSRALASLGKSVRIVEPPPGVLHFKTACALLSEDTILATPTLAASGLFEGFRVVTTPEGEEPAANLIRINDLVLVSGAYLRTAERLTELGLSVRLMDVREIAKLDAGLSCLSLRWAKR